MWRVSLKTPLTDAQWTGITTRLGERLLESGNVDAVLAMSGDLDDRWRPVPVLVTRADDMKLCRGMRMGRTRTIAFLQLPLSDLPPDFFPLTCRTSVDYTNSLADIKVGYMGGQGQQWPGWK